MSLIIKTKRLHKDARIPRRATEGAAAVDLSAAHVAHIAPGTTGVVKVGLAVELPTYTVGLICSRSGLAAKHGVFVLNAPGAIDEDYRGELAVILHNAGREPFTVYPGDRIAQFMVLEIAPIEFEEVEELGNTERGEGGLGSTGVKQLEPA